MYNINIPFKILKFKKNDNWGADKHFIFRKLGKVAEHSQLRGILIQYVERAVNRQPDSRAETRIAEAAKIYKKKTSFGLHTHVYTRDIWADTRKSETNKQIYKDRTIKRVKLYRVMVLY